MTEREGQEYFFVFFSEESWKTLKSKIVSRPTKKQNRVHNLPKSKIVATTPEHSGTPISSREQKKGSPLSRNVMTPNRRNPFIWCATRQVDNRKTKKFFLPGIAAGQFYAASFNLIS